MSTTADPKPPLLFVGGIVIGVGFGITGILTFPQFRTAVQPHRPASVLVDTGIYADTRNPMYTGLTVAHEERYFRTRFPEAYAAYCARVGRWCRCAWASRPPPRSRHSQVHRRQAVRSRCRLSRHAPAW
jgi:protein-S-isoprenylcysteine O-methyltransferase Ste14